MTIWNFALDYLKRHWTVLLLLLVCLVAVVLLIVFGGIIGQRIAQAFGAVLAVFGYSSLSKRNQAVLDARTMERKARSEAQAELDRTTKRIEEEKASQRKAIDTERSARVHALADDVSKKPSADLVNDLLADSKRLEDE